MPVDTPVHRFHNRPGAPNSLKEEQKSLERALEDAVSRALRDNLAPLQRTADELHQAYADLVAACSSTRPSNALPAMLRAQTAAAALAAGLSVLSNFVAVALNPREAQGAAAASAHSPAAVAEAEDEPAPHHAGAATESEEASEWAEEPAAAIEAPADHHARRSAPPRHQPAAHSVSEAPPAEAVVELDEPAETPAPAFSVAALPAEMQELHRRANRVAKVAMQDIKMLRPKDVRLGCEHKDICNRLRSDLDKARKEYDRRFRAILDHPVDYFLRWMVDILAEGDSAALGEYPYPSPALRR